LCSLGEDDYFSEDIRIQNAALANEEMERLESLDASLVVGGHICSTTLQW
jgi:hypothetical protein